MKVLCVHSFAVHGTASLKAVLSILGSRVLAIPSLYLSGLTNIPGYVKTEVPFQQLFDSSLDLARRRKERLILYIGYLGNAGQAKVILEGIEANRDLIDAVLVDPVSGDQGRIYVPDEVLSVWPELLECADWAFPNYTELQLYAGENLLDTRKNPDPSLKAFQQKFPKLSFVVTSLPDPDGLRLGLFHQKEKILFGHTKVQAHYGGTGDVFVALFILYAFLKKTPYAEAMEKAAIKTLEIIKYSQKMKSPDLLILPEV